jgi:uncharacterized protein with HEPN domain
MNEEDKSRLLDMLWASQKAFAFAEGRKRSDLAQDDMLAFALARALELVGEAGVSTETREAHPQIRWKSIVGMRHRLIHGYRSVDHDIVWETVQKVIPSFIKKLERILESEG